MNHNRIAIFMKDGAIVESLSSANTIVVFERKDTKWINIGEHYVNLSIDLTAPMLRAEIRRVAEKLGDCRICAGLQISGVIYRELDRMGFSIFEIPQCSGEILDHILRDIEEERASGDIIAGSVDKPVQTDMPGVYYFDLQRLQAEKPEISSKQALKDFLETVPFYELHLVCAHIPPWINDGIYDICDEQTGDNRIIATIKKKQCGGEKYE